ncbi:hypothetical protein NMG60_11023302 [Bertholletia excelsa]
MASLYGLARPPQSVLGFRRDGRRPSSAALLPFPSKTPFTSHFPAILRALTAYLLDRYLTSYCNNRKDHCHLKLAENAPLSKLIKFNNGVSLHLKQNLLTAFASNPSDSDSLGEKANEVKDADAGQGPPFLTILAGLLVFLAVCWIVGSTLTWLVGLIFRLPPK